MLDNQYSGENAAGLTQDRFEKILSALGPPAARGDKYAIYRGDCTDVLAQIPPSSLDLVVTSPPYNIGKEYEQVLHTDEYLSWCESWIALTHRAISPSGAFWLNLGYLGLAGQGKAVPISYLLWNRTPFFLIQEIVWHYGAGVAARTSFSPRNEKFLWYVKDPEHYVFNLDDVRDPNVKYPNQKKNGKLKCNPLGKNPTDVWQFPKVTSGRDRSSKERTAHPAQFPIAVVDRIVRACSNTGDVVIDPFLGSGSLIEASLKSGRYSIGVEINREYVSLARERITRYLQEQARLATQGRLF
jgi:adenine-specific DNA-methyltransferase